jgi:hypothetical protein
MKKIENFIDSKMPNLSSVYGGDLKHTSFVFFGTGVEDAFSDTNGNGVADEGEPFLLVSQRP